MKTPLSPYPQLKLSVAFISPERAMELLASNQANQRAIARKNLAKIEHDFAASRFVLTGQPIILSSAGQVLDGQHRLTACVNTKVGFWTVLVEGVSPEVFAYIDTGKSRTLAVALGIKGEASKETLAASLLRLAEYRWDPARVGCGIAFSDAEKLDVLAAMPDVRASIAYCRGLKMDRTIPTAATAWLHCLTSQHAPLRAQVFFEKLASGEMLPSESPIFVLRQRLLAAKTAKNKLPLRSLLALLIKAWNAHAQELPLKMLKWSEAEAFPLPMLPSESAGLRAAAN